jgi:hypothetical protein
VLLTNAEQPTATLLPPETLQYKAEIPTAVFNEPVVLNLKALLPQCYISLT